MKYGKRIVLFTLFAMNLVDQPAPEVQIEQGILSGITSGDGTYFEYIGIPYATTNSSVRFKAPLPPPSWEGVYHATREYSCPQPTFFGVKGIEDCLKINVYVPTMAKRPIPVMVFIHGGAFILGSGGKLVYSPDFLVKQDVILVTFNYRLGALGFTCLGVEEAPGNAGLKDQIAALRWVRKNIAAFGGDPDNVTLFGQSAGGTSTSLLLASDLTDGLFHKAIVQSGSALASWSINRYPLWVASLLAKELGHDTEDPKEIYNILKDLPYKELVAVNPQKPIGKYLDTELLHLPCIEKTFPGIEAVITDLPFNVIKKKSKNIPIMFGTTSNEGLFIVSRDNNQTIRKRDEKYLFASDLHFPTEEEAQEVDLTARRHYFGDEKMTIEKRMNISRLMTHLYFEFPSITETALIANNVETPLFNYYFDYDGGRNLLKYLSGMSEAEGTCHADELLYLFNGNIWPLPPDARDKRMIDVMTKMWTNFAKYGDPTPSFTDLPVKWKPTTKKEVNMLYIDDHLRMGSLPNPDAYGLWKNIYEKYRKTEINSYGD